MQECVDNLMQSDNFQRLYSSMAAEARRPSVHCQGHPLTTQTKQNCSFNYKRNAITTSYR